MSIDRVLAFAAAQPWALMPEKIAEISAFLSLRADGVRFTSAEIEARIGSDRAGEPGQSQGGVAVIPLFGIVSQRASIMSEISGPGGTSTERVGIAFRQAIADPNVRAIVLEVHSPGGSTFGVMELADEIRAARGRKPIVAQVNSLCASAAYWIASGASEIVATPGADIGSIGVWSAHENMAEMMKRIGVEKTFVSAGDYKVENHPYGPMTDEGRAYMQKRVNEAYGDFVGAVSRGRGKSTAVVRADFGKGRMMGARDALRVGMVDRIGTMQETMRRLAGNASSTSRPVAASAGSFDASLDPRYRRHQRRLQQL